MEDRLKHPKVYRTDNADLATYLIYNEIEFLGCDIDINPVTKKPVAVMMFNDRKEQARDLERMYYTSKEKRFRDLNKYILKEIHKAVKNHTRSILGEE